MKRTKTEQKKLTLNPETLRTLTGGDRLTPDGVIIRLPTSHSDCCEPG